MTAILVIIGIVIGLNCIPLLTKLSFPKVEKTIQKILLASTVLFLTVEILAFNGYRLKGAYTFSVITWTFILSTVAYFVVFKNTKKKLFTILVLTPLTVFSISTFMLDQLVCQKRIDVNNKLTVTTGGFLTCGEVIHISQTRVGIFDKEVFHSENLCLIGINKIETVKLDKKSAEILIYHNGKNDSENPFRYEIERNGW